MPQLNHEKARWETSTYRNEGLPDDRIWQLGYDHVENATANRRIKARGVGPFNLVSAAGLDTDVNGPPFPRHVDLISWSLDDKDRRLMHATEIADKLRLFIDPRASD